MELSLIVEIRQLDWTGLASPINAPLPCQVGEMTGSDCMNLDWCFARLTWDLVLVWQA